MKLPEGVLAYSLLTCANLSEDQQQLCRATVSDFTYKDMKETIEKVVTHVGNQAEREKPVLKDYPFYTNYEESTASDQFMDNYESHDVYESSEEFQDNVYPPQSEIHPGVHHGSPEDTYYTQYRGYRGRSSSQPSRMYPKDNRGRGYERPSTQNPSSQNRPALNPTDEFGKPMPCSFCHSVYHWVSSCPHVPDSVKNSRGRGSNGRGRSRRSGSGWPPAYKRV